MKHLALILSLAGLLATMSAAPAYSQGKPAKGCIQVEAKARNSKHPELEKWVKYPTMTVDSLGFALTKPDRLNRYGSLADGPVFKATGFYHTDKYEGRWITVDPEGRMHLDAVVCGVIPGRGETNKAAYKEKFGTRSVWMEKTADLLASAGFNGTGNWADIESVIAFNRKNPDMQLSYCPFLGLMSSYGKSLGVTTQRPGNTGYPNQCILAFDPGFEQFCEEKIAEVTAKYKGDPNLMGYFSDNEMPLGRSNLEGYLDLPEDNWGHKAAVAWMASRGLTREQLTDEIKCEFAGYVAEKYYSTVARILKKYDPDHMYLGSRLHGNAKYIKEVYQAAARWCDVISLNFYGFWDVREKDRERWDNWVDRPFIVTEFYTKGEDSGMGNTTGAGWRVRTQKDRGLHYENFIISLLRTKSCVGWHWFKYQDNDPTAKGVDPSNIDANKGMVDNRFEPYEDLVASMKKVNGVRYGIMFGFMKEK